jgi:hypothetical protein
VGGDLFYYSLARILGLAEESKKKGKIPGRPRVRGAGGGFVSYIKSQERKSVPCLYSPVEFNERNGKSNNEKPGTAPRGAKGSIVRGFFVGRFRPR